MTLSWRSKLVHPQVGPPPGFKSLASPTYRGSTTLFDTAARVPEDWDHERVAYGYGAYGTPTSLELALRIGDLEGAKHTFLTPGGQAAISTIYLTFARSSGHVLLPDSAYGPNRQLSERLLSRLGIETECYDPLIGAGIAALIRPNTQLIWCESPGSVTMEVQDVPAIAAAAKAAGVPVALDNTYAAGVHFDAFRHGADVSMQALTKYVGGHSDLLLGSVSLATDQHYQALGDAHQLLGMSVSPDDCSLALRGLQTLAVRLTQLEASTLAVARWLAQRPEIDRVLHPAFASCPGHDIWRRDFIGSSSLFSVVFPAETSKDSIIAFVDRLKMFKLGYSWGGVTSLVMPQFQLHRDRRGYGHRLVRFNIGLEDPEDLTADLAAALTA
jgi:cystathionine beta-lyase